MSLLDKLEKFQKKDSLQGGRKISPERKKIIISEQKIPKLEKLNDSLKINKSLELNLIKSVYANRFGSTTNKLKSDMQKAIIEAWKIEHEKGKTD